MAMASMILRFKCRQYCAIAENTTENIEGSIGNSHFNLFSSEMQNASEDALVRMKPAVQRFHEIMRP